MAELAAADADELGARASRAEQSSLLKEHRLLRAHATVGIADGDSDHVLAARPAERPLPFDLQRAHHAAHGALEPLVDVNPQVRAG